MGRRTPAVLFFGHHAPMKLAELDADETLALVALCRAIVLSDGSISGAEAEAVPEIIAALGEEPYRRAFAAARERFADDAALEAFLPSIGRPAARALIHTTVLRLARKDGLAPEEARLLDRVATLWKLV
jgi:uncharacterized tellurite resistance protein B-like protein